MTECFELTYHGGGGFSWSEVWQMPVTTRRFNLKKITEYLEKVEELRNEGQKTVTEKTDVKKLKFPDIPKAKQEEAFVSKVKTKR